MDKSHATVFIIRRIHRTYIHVIFFSSILVVCFSKLCEWYIKISYGWMCECCNWNFFRETHFWDWIMIVLVKQQYKHYSAFHNFNLKDHKNYCSYSQTKTTWQWFPLKTMKVSLNWAHWWNHIFKYYL